MCSLYGSLLLVSHGWINVCYNGRMCWWMTYLVITGRLPWKYLWIDVTTDDTDAYWIITSVRCSPPIATCCDLVLLLEFVMAVPTYYDVLKDVTLTPRSMCSYLYWLDPLDRWMDMMMLLSCLAPIKMLPGNTCVCTLYRCSYRWCVYMLIIR